MREIITALDGKVPVIVFSKDAHGDWPALVNTGANVLGLDWTLNLQRTAAKLPAQCGSAGKSRSCAADDHARNCRDGKLRKLLESMANRPGYIFNLGHGVPPDAKLECIQALVDTVKAHGGKSRTHVRRTPEMNTLQVDLDLVRKYNVAGPRYTSYPPATKFTDGYFLGGTGAAHRGQ